MLDCVLHVAGENFDPELFLSTAALEPYAVFRRGDKRFPKLPGNDKVHLVGGFSCLASASDSSLAVQIENAIAFLERYQDDLLRLTSVASVNKKELSFGYCLRMDGDKVFVQFDYLPPHLLKLAGNFGIGISLSLYPTSD